MTVEFATYDETAIDTLAELCIEDAIAVRRGMAAKRYVETQPFSLRDADPELARNLGALSAGWQIRLADPQDVASWNHNKYNARLLNINSMALDEVYLGTDGEILGKSLSVFDVDPSQKMLGGPSGRWHAEWMRDMSADDMAHLRVLLGDAWRVL
jgi:hypothetical protein